MHHLATAVTRWACGVFGRQAPDAGSVRVAAEAGQLHGCFRAVESPSGHGRVRRIGQFGDHALQEHPSFCTPVQLSQGIGEPAEELTAVVRRQGLQVGLLQLENPRVVADDCLQAGARESGRVSRILRSAGKQPLAE